MACTHALLMYSSHPGRTYNHDHCRVLYRVLVILRHLNLPAVLQGGSGECVCWPDRDDPDIPASLFKFYRGSILKAPGNFIKFNILASREKVYSE